MSASFRSVATLLPRVQGAGMVRSTAVLAPRVAASSFHSTAYRQVAVGDKIPDLTALHESAPGAKVNLAQELAGTRGLIIGVPAAFSGICTQHHIPGYINHSKLKDAGKVFVVSVNDVFVVDAWHKQLDPQGKAPIRFLADPEAAFTKALDLTWDGTAVFGGLRGKRYALVVEDGKVKEAHVEPDNTGTAVSLAEQVLGKN